MVDRPKWAVAATIFAWTIIGLSLPADQAVGQTGEAEVEERISQFKLFSNCKPMDLVVESLHSDASEIGLTKEAIQAAVESRLRSAQLYSSESIDTYLYVNVHISVPAFNISFEYNKVVYDPASGLRGSATTWSLSSTGTSGMDSGYILSVVSKYMDLFLLEYLRVNESACKQRFTVPNTN